MNLKPIKIVEDNMMIKDIPDNAYCYAGADFIVYYLSNLSNLKVRSDLRVTARKDLYYFKINKYSNQDIRFEGYISDQAEVLLNKNKGLLDVGIMVFPKIYNEYKNIYEFSLIDKDVSIKTRSINDGNDTINLIEIMKIKLIQEEAIKINNLMNTTHKSGKNISNENSITNNPTFAFIVGTLIIFFISYLLFKIFGFKISDFI